MSDVLLPDRDNTFSAYLYDAGGGVQVSRRLSSSEQKLALATLTLVGLQQPGPAAADANGRLIALDRIKQRLEAWLMAEYARDNLLALRPGDVVVVEALVLLAQKTGFFSVWMEVFRADPAIRNRLIDAFAGTRESGCFDAQTSAPVAPAPNPDQLPHGSML